MALLWYGGEDIDFQDKHPDQVVMSSDGGYYRIGYARGCLVITSDAGYAKGVTFLGGTVTACWLGFRLAKYSFGANQLFVGLGASGTTKSGLYVGTDPSNANKLALYKYDGTTKTQVGSSESGTSLAGVTQGTKMKIDMQVSDFGATADVKVYFEGTEVISAENVDVTVTGVTSIDCVMLNSTIAGKYTAASEIIVADEDTRLMELVTNYPNEAGTTNDWGGAYTDIDELALNDADEIYDNDGDDDFQANLSALPTGSYTIRSHKIAARFRKSADSSMGTLKLGVNSGGTVDVDAGHAATTAWVTAERYMATNPVTTNPWEVSEINALQADVQSDT